MKGAQKTPNSPVANTATVQSNDTNLKDEVDGKNEWSPVPEHLLGTRPEQLRAQKVRVSYPPLAEKLRIEGNVILSVEITKNGEVRHAQVLEGVGFGLDEEALAAIKRFRFTPATDEHGVSVDTTIRHVMKFRLF